MEQAPVPLFCICACADACWYQRLRGHLGPALLARRISLYEQASVSVGRERLAELTTCLDEAAVRDTRKMTYPECLVWKGEDRRTTFLRKVRADVGFQERPWPSWSVSHRCSRQW